MNLISIHSFRGGTGKSTVSSNIATYLASLGNKVLIIDTDIKSPGVHAIFGMHENSFSMTFNDFLSGDCQIQEIVYDVSDRLKLKRGKLFLVPSCIEYGMIAATLVGKQSQELMKKALEQLSEKFDLDFLIIDTHPGINEEVLIAADLADVNLIIARPDNQDYQGLKVSTDIFHRMGLKPSIILSKVHKKVDIKKTVKMVQDVFECPVIGILPFSEEVMMNESKSVFYKEYPRHQYSLEIKRLSPNS